MRNQSPRPSFSGFGQPKRLCPRQAALLKLLVVGEDGGHEKNMETFIFRSPAFRVSGKEG